MRSGNSTSSSKSFRGCSFIATSNASTTSANSFRDRVPFPTALRKADLKTPINLSNRPPHYGAELRLNLHVMSF